MKTCMLMLMVMVVAACASKQVSCDGRLVAINHPGEPGDAGRQRVERRP